MVGPNDRYMHPDAGVADPTQLRSIDPDLPTLFLDVDGVLNAIDRKNPDHAWGDGRITHAQPSFANRTWPIYTSTKIGPALLALGVNIVWLTTWKYEANLAISPLVGLPQDLPVGDGAHHWGDFQAWKTDVVVDHLDRYDHPVIWIDDEAIPYGFEHRSFHTNTQTVLTVRTNPYQGLLPTEVEQVSEWLELWVRGTK